MLNGRWPVAVCHAHLRSSAGILAGFSEGVLRLGSASVTPRRRAAGTAALHSVRGKLGHYPTEPIRVGAPNPRTISPPQCSFPWYMHFDAVEERLGTDAQSRVDLQVKT
jgi:hypothetical protein